MSPFRFNPEYQELPPEPKRDHHIPVWLRKMAESRGIGLDDWDALDALLKESDAHVNIVKREVNDRKRG